MLNWPLKTYRIFQHICKNMGRIFVCNMQPDALTVSTWGALKIHFSNMTHSPNQSKFLRVNSPRIWKSGKISDFVDMIYSCSYLVHIMFAQRKHEDIWLNSISIPSRNHLVVVLVVVCNVSRYRSLAFVQWTTDDHRLHPIFSGAIRLVVHRDLHQDPWRLSQSLNGSV